MRKVSFVPLFLTLLSILILFSGCGSPSSKSSSSGRIFQTETPGPTPTPLPTAMPIPSQAELNGRFNAEINPLIEKLMAASLDPAAVVNAEYEIIYVPQTDRLYFTQSILHLTRPAPSSGSKHAYILYNYSRGGDLGKSYKNKPKFYENQPDTQTITSSIRLVIEDQGKFTLVQEKEATGGEGSKSYQELVTNSVLTLDKLPVDSQITVNHDLEEIIGYACGIDMTPTFDFYRRAEVLSKTLQSDYWADRRQGILALLAMNPLPTSIASNIYDYLSDADVGNEVAETLARIADDPQVFKMVLEAAISPIVESRQRAAFILGSIPSKPGSSLAPLMKLVTDNDSTVRDSAAQGLAKLDNPTAVDQLIVMLDDPNETTRQYAVEALSQYYSNKALAVPKLTTMLKENSPLIRQAVARSLRYMREDAKGALPELIDAARKEKDPDAFRAEIETIADISSEAETLPLLKESMVSTWSEIRIVTCSILSMYYRVSGITDILLIGLSDKDDAVREAAAASLTTLESLAAISTPDWPGEEAKSAIPALITALNDSSENVKYQASDALGKLGTAARSAVPALIDAMKKDENNRYYYVSALQEITKVDFSEDTQKWADWWEENKNQ